MSEIRHRKGGGVGQYTDEERVSCPTCRDDLRKFGHDVTLDGDTTEFVKDGRLITERRAAALDTQIDNVAAWVKELADEKHRESNEAAGDGDYICAAENQAVADFLDRLVTRAERGDFLPPHLRPCVDGAGNRGNHLKYISGVGGRDSSHWVCTFCGRT